jgi:hypothetical protein
MFPGFTSRWMMPAWCAAARAPAAWIAYSSANGIGTGDSSINASSGRPSTNSIAMNVTSPAVSMS